jgi:hypothetical protein
MSIRSATEKVFLYQGIRDVLLSAQQQVRQTVNTTMVQAYWQIGRPIVEDEQGGRARAEYGKRVLPELAKRLTSEFGKGFSAPSLWNYRQFHLEFPILSTAWRELSWSHFRMLLRIKDAQARTWYATEAVIQGRSVRALGSRDKAEVQAEAVALMARDAPADNAQLFASKYQLLMPSEDDLRAELERDRALLESARAVSDD